MGTSRARRVGLLENAAEFFGLSLKQARATIREVANVTRTWQAVAQEVGCRCAEIARMASAFEHDDLDAALQL
jgi:serine/threonine-protein kinase HipA